MNKNLLAIGLTISLISCQSKLTDQNTSTATEKTNKPQVQSTTADNSKALLLDGTWEVDYMMTKGTPFAELFTKGKPTLNFNSLQNNVSGTAGCNNYSGTVTVEANKIKFGENMAVTKKMCAEGMEGERLFLETLPKINSYSISEGKTLNLIMGDMAIMRAQRK